MTLLNSLGFLCPMAFQHYRRKKLWMEFAYGQIKSSHIKCLSLLAFFISNTFVSNTRLFWHKIKQMLSNNLTLNFYYLKIIRILQLCYHPKIIRRIPKNKQKTRINFHEIIWLITIKMKNKSQ